MSTPPKDARVEDLYLQKAIPDLAELYDRFAHALDPFSEQSDQAERVFGEYIAELYDLLGPPKPTFHEFQKAIIVRCKLHLTASRKNPTV